MPQPEVELAKPMIDQHDMKKHVNPPPDSGWRHARLAPSLAEVYRTIPIRGGSWWRKMLAFAGPGYLVAVGYMDPGNWATDLAGGALFGYSLLSVILMSNIMAVLLQGLASKLGIVTGRDLAQACRDHYSRPVSFMLWIICELAIAACERWRGRAAGAGRRIAVHWGCGDALADVDPLRVSQALDNLIANALEHGGGPITLEGLRKGDRIDLIVRDSGTTRGERLREHADPRRGHGLRITRRLARGNGGELKVGSSRRTGTVAALVLPLVPERKKPISPHHL